MLMVREKWKMTEQIIKTIERILTLHPIETILNHIITLIGKVPMEFNAENIKGLSTKDGVYLVFEKPVIKEKFIYVGETRTLKGRLTSIKDARMRNGKPTNHTFIGKLNKKYNEFDELKLREIVGEKYVFSFIEVESKEMAFVIEGIIQRIYGNQLWNNPRKSIIPV